MKIDSNPITAGTPEKSYTTWMVLHYTLTGAATSTSLQNKADDGTVYSDTLMFLPSTAPPTPAISIVLYNNSLGAEDEVCDQHSADAFDAIVKTFWGQSGLYRSFPELYYETGIWPLQQTHRYNGSCATRITSASMNMASDPKEEVQKVKEIIDSISSLRTELGKSQPDFERANGVLVTTRELIDHYWHRHWHRQVPELVQLDLDHARTAILQGIDRKTGTVLDAEFTLWPTMFILTPGRIDCHAAQVNVNGAIP
jgi:hypothetical protein